MDIKDLNTIKQFLAKEGMKVELMPPSNELPLEHLHVSLDEDYKKRQLAVLLWIETEEGKNKVSFLQVMLLFPFNFIDESLLSTGRYLLMVNKSLAFPGFGLSEPDRSIYYRYTLSLTDDRSETMHLIHHFIGFVAMIYDAFAPKIEPLANGEKTFEETIWKG